MAPMHYETGWPNGPKECACTDGVDHDRDGVPARPATILGRPAPRCRTCGTVRVGGEQRD